MRKSSIICFFVTLLALCQASLAAFVAVLETISPTGVLELSERQFLTDELRSQAGFALPTYMGYTIMTRENINVMLPPGKTLEDCEGSCIAETGRNIAADYVAQARVGRFGEKLTLTIEIYETAGSKLIASQTSMQSSATELWDDIKANAKSLFEKIREQTLPFVSPVAKETPSEKKDLEDSNKKVRIVFSKWNKSPFDTVYVNSKMKSLGIEQKENYGIMEDRRSGLSYKIIDVDSTLWMVENLNFLTTESDCYEGSPLNCEKYGRLYSWYDAMGFKYSCSVNRCFMNPDKAIQGVCPEGWSIPSIEDWNKLGRAISANSKIKEIFNNPLSGRRYMSGSFMQKGEGSWFWTRNEKDNVDAYGMSIDGRGELNRINVDSYGKNFEFSVRCVHY